MAPTIQRRPAARAWRRAAIPLALPLAVAAVLGAGGCTLRQTSALPPDAAVVPAAPRVVLDAGGRPGALYAEDGHADGTVIVGLLDEFELTFTGGRLLRWAGPGGVNRTVRPGLGPWVTPADGAGGTGLNAGATLIPILLFSPTPPPETRAAPQSLAASAFRCVVVCRWEFAPPAVASEPVEESLVPAGSPSTVEWRWTIYPGGETYLGLSIDPGSRGWAATPFSDTLLLDGRAAFAPLETPAPNADDADPPPAGYVHLADAGCDAGLLWAPAVPPPSASFATSPDGRQQAVTLGPYEPPAGPLAAAHLLHFLAAPPAGDPDELLFGDLDPESSGSRLAGLSPAAGAALVAQYRAPAELAFARGGLHRQGGGDLDADGFNESEGLYELRPAGGILRFRLDPGPRPRRNLRFRVHDTVGREAWVYRDGRPIAELGRDEAGRVLFLLSGAVRSPAALEVIVR